MTVDDFRKSLTAARPPVGPALALAGLWWEAKGNWTGAHESAQDEGPEGSWRTPTCIAKRAIKVTQPSKSKRALIPRFR